MCEEVGDARWNVQFGMYDAGYEVIPGWLNTWCLDTVYFRGLTCSSRHKRSLTDGENQENGEGRVTLRCLRDSTILYVWRVILSQAGVWNNMIEHFENFLPILHHSWRHLQTCVILC